MATIEYLKETNRFNEMTTSEIFNEMLDGYMGTCSGMAEEDFNWLDENGQLTNWDSFIFNCNCGWWCDVSEEHDEGYCGDCEPDA